MISKLRVGVALEFVVLSSAVKVGPLYKWLNKAKNKIEKISGLMALIQLEYLHLGGNQIS